MEPRNIIMKVLLSVLIILSISTGVQAQELREVNATEILKRIENGEELPSYENVLIKGDFNLSKITLKTISCSRSKILVQYDDYRLEEKLKIVKTKIIIKKSIFENDLDFSNTLFSETVDFKDTSFLNKANFKGTNFTLDADFSGVKFNKDALFQGAYFRNYAFYNDATFKGNAKFDLTNYTGGAEFKNATFTREADFSGAKFTENVDFSGTNFIDFTRFKVARFKNAEFSDVKFSGLADFGNSNFNNAYFMYASFNDANFTYVNFSNNADFSHTSFNVKADFGNANFSNSTFDHSTFNGADFIYTSFRGYAQFYNVNSIDDVTFRNAIFRDYANFDDTKFDKLDISNTAFSSLNKVSINNSDFKTMEVYWNEPSGSSLKDALVFNEPVYLRLIKNFRDIGRFEDADDAYYQYRELKQTTEEGILWYWDEFQRIIYGYGVRPWNIILSGLFLMLILFPIIYLLLGIPSLVYALECSGATFIKGYNRDIIKSNELTYSNFLNKMPVKVRITLNILEYRFTNIDLLIKSFTSMKRELAWVTRIRLVKVCMFIEGLFGWLILALFIVTLGHITIRP